jgi:DNA-binding transcriptional MerR regulator/predicted transcriptional regulator YdeE
MLKISDFSRLARIPAKTLRYYDEIDLFKPDQIDPWTGYRYYTPAQLPRLNRILALRSLGLALDQIKVLLGENLSAEQIRGMLRLRQAEVQQQLAKEQARLDQIESVIRQLENAGKMNEYAVVLKAIEALQVAGRQGVVPSPGEYGIVFTRLFDAVTAYLKQNGSYPAGGGLALYLDEEYQERDIHVEAAFPVPPNPPQGTDEIKIHTLPAVEQMACVVHQGPYEGLKHAYAAAMQWLSDNSYQINGSVREIYVHSDPTSPDNHITEIQMPVQKR